MRMILSGLAPALAAAAIAFALTPLIARIAVRVGAVDMPGRRKVHARPTPRLGGLAVVASIAVVWFGSYWLIGPVLPAELMRGLSVGLVPLLTISIVDDVRPVGVGWKFLAQTVAACIAVASGVSLGADVHLFGPIHLGMFAAPLSVLWLVGVTNAFNLIDGLDGLSAGLALIAALSMAAVFALVGQPAMAAAALVLAGALAGFLPYNIHPARLFLGDSGATAIGFCLGAFALKGGSTLSSGFAALVPVFIMGLPIADTLIAMARRAVRRVEDRQGGVFEADRNHIHHRLLALGVNHGRAVLVLYGAGAILAAAAFGSMFLKAQDAALFIVALLVAGFVGVHRLGFDEFAFLRRGTMLRVYDTPVVKRSMFVVFVDLATVAVAAYLARGLKFDAWNLAEGSAQFVDLMVTFAPLTAVIFWYSGMYRGGWRLAGVTELAHASGAALAVSAAGYIVHHVLATVPQPPSVFLIYALLSVVLVTMSRGSYVVLLTSQRRASVQGVPALLYGAGRDGVAAVSELLDRPGAGLRPVGFVDDNAASKGRRVSGLPILGTTCDLDSLVALHGIKALLVTGRDVDAARLAGAADTCGRLGIQLIRMRVLLDVDSDFSRQAPVGSYASRTPGVPTLTDIEVPAPHAIVLASPAAALSVQVVEAEPCGNCGGRHVHRSKARGVYERLRKVHTPRRPYRCEDCGWRGWLLPLEQATPFFDGYEPAVDAVAGQQNLPRPAAWGRQEERREGVPGDRGGEAPSPEANPELAI